MAFKNKEKIFEEIIERICEGESLSDILKKGNRKEGLPSFSTFFEWLEQDEAKQEKYARAREVLIEREVDEIKMIADGDLFIEEEEWEVNEEGKKVLKRVTKKANYQQKKQMIDARIWRATKINSGKYGNNAKVDLNHTKKVSINIDLGSEDDDEE